VLRGRPLRRASIPPDLSLHLFAWHFVIESDRCRIALRPICSTRHDPLLFVGLPALGVGKRVRLRRRGIRGGRRSRRCTFRWPQPAARLPHTLRCCRSIGNTSRLRSRSAAALIVFGALVPGVFVVIPMVIAIIVTFAITITRSNDAGRHDRHQGQQRAGRSNSTHIRMLLRGS